MRVTSGALASGLALWLVPAEPDTLVAIPQREPVRSVFAPPSADLSADGRYLAFESRARLVAADADDRLDVYVFDRSTGRVTLESGAFDAHVESARPVINADGRYLVFESRRATAAQPLHIEIVLCDRLAGTTRVLTRSGRFEPSDGWSRGPDISDDGRVMVFSSTATNLTDEPDTNSGREDVYVAELPAGTIRRVKVDAASLQPGVGSTSHLPSVSADGRWVAFASTALVGTTVTRAPAGQRFPVRQVFLQDLASGRTIRASRGLRGGAGDGDSSVPTISGDGRYVAFTSDATNLVSDDRNRTFDIFLYDRITDTLALVSRGADGSTANGGSATPSISADGRFIAFQSDASNLVCARRCLPGEEDINLLWDVFVFDRVNGKTMRASEDELGGWMEPSTGPVLGAAGRVVAFSSRHPMDAGDRGNDLDLFVRALAMPAAITKK